MVEEGCFPKILSVRSCYVLHFQMWCKLSNGLDDMEVALYGNPNHRDTGIPSDHCYLVILEKPLCSALNVNSVLLFSLIYMYMYYVVFLFPDQCRAPKRNHINVSSRVDSRPAIQWSISCWGPCILSNGSPGSAWENQLSGRAIVGSRG